MVLLFGERRDDLVLSARGRGERPRSKDNAGGAGVRSGLSHVFPPAERRRSELKVHPGVNLPVGDLLTVVMDGVLRLDEEVRGDLADLHDLAGAQTNWNVAEVVLEIEVPDAARAKIEALRQVVEDDGSG
jgi:hypothetical protein